MLKRNLLKRVLPIMLSVAMAFQSVPMTALAVEDPGAVVSTTEADPATEPEASETPSPDGDDSLGLTEDTSAASDSNQTSDGTTTDTDDSESETTDAGSGTETGSTETETGNAETETGNTETEVSKTETTDAETETETSDGESKEDVEQPGEDAQVTVTSTDITVDEGVLTQSLPSGFARDNGESRLSYTVPYSENDQFGAVMGDVKDAASIIVNGEAAPEELKDDYLILEWKEVKKAEDGTETLEAMTGTPQNAGNYALHLDTRVQEGVCGKPERDVNVYFNIAPKKLTLTFEGGADAVLCVDAGSKVADFKADVEKVVKLSDDNGYFTTLQYSIAAKVYKVGEATETTDAVFVKDADYKVKVEATLDAAALSNYEVTGGEYLITFEGLLETRVDVEGKDPTSEIVKTYKKGTSYKAADIAAEYGISAVVKAKGADGEFAPFGAEVADADKQAVPKWYLKEINTGNNINGFPTEAEVDGITQFYGQDNALYTLMTEESIEEVGEYYLVYVYEGLNGKYDKSYSDPIKVTIDPIEVILVPNKVGELKTGMTSEAINKTLAEVVSELRVPDAADATLASGTKSDAPAADKDFYGVSYDDTGATQYYSPVFELVRKTRNKLPEAQWPANATEDQKWSEWTAPARTTELKLSDDKTEYKYYIRFTGEKAVYNADGTQKAKLPVAEATDSANRNYKVKTDSDTLYNEKNMLEVTLGEAAKTTVDVSAIIEEFNMSGRSKGGSGLTVDDPAWTIFDPDSALFADRASYKKAVVTSEIKDTHKDITYTWQRGDMDQYYALSRMEKDADETDEAFAKRKERAAEALEASFSDCSSEFYPAPSDAGFYRLHIVYKDSSLIPKNMPAVGDAYFLIKKQELILVADTQYAKYGEDTDNFTKQGYSVYALPGNDESALDLNSAAPLNWDAWYLNWQAMNLKKNPDGSNSAEWENSTGTFIKDDAYPYVYKAAVWLDDAISGEIEDTDGNTVTNKANSPVEWVNYTTKNMAAWDADKGDYKQHYKVGEGFGDIKFDAGEIAIVVDRSKLFDDKIYDGKPIADALPEGFVKLTDKATGAEIPATTLKVNGEPQDGVGTVRVEWMWDMGGIVPTEEAKYGGTYKLVAFFEGNDTYSPLRANDNWNARWVELTDKDGKVEFEIKPLDVEITPVLKEEVIAGDPLFTMLDADHVEAKTVDPNRKIPDGTDGSSDDRWLFECGDGNKLDATSGSLLEYTNSYPILNEEENAKFDATYYEDNEEVQPSYYIRYGRKYDVRLDNPYGLFAQYASSYKLTFKPATLANIVREEANVKATGFFRDTLSESNGKVSVYTEKDKDGTYKIAPREGIPFVYDDYTLLYTPAEEIPLNKNYIAIKMVAPREFDRESGDFARNNFIFENSIKAANGYVIAKGLDSEEGRYAITALFPVDLDESGKIVDPEKKFSITWEEGYTDNFNLNLTNAKLEANLKKAVAPKALAFKGVQKKMAVGEEQQLDVKITKAQLGDVIRIRYRLGGGETSNQYASINPETGVITALATNNKKPVAVNIEAYPVRLAEDGKTYEEITGKNVKVAKAKVTVTEVTAPVIKKVIPKDISAEVQYTKVDNGYRREIYVVKLANKKDAKKWKAANFETAIENMTNGQWQDTFAIEPKYYAGTSDYNAKLKLCSIGLNFKELESSAYVVYVRNVSAARALADGSKVTLSAAGTVKMFETTKSQVKGLDPYFEVTPEKTKQNPVRYYNDEDDEDGYIVELADKSAQLLVKGLFLEKPYDASADSSDYSWWQLSLKAAEKALERKLTDKYQDPKLSYYVTDGNDPEFDEKNKIKNPSKYVTISNKGKLTFKGVDKNGEVTVKVCVRADNGVSGSCMLTVTARPDTLTTKKVKTMKVGDAIRLADYLEYKRGKAKVPYYWSSNIDIKNRDEVEEAGFSIYQAASNSDTHPAIDGKLRKGEYIIVATKEGGRCDLKFTDLLWKSDSNDKAETEVKSITLSTAKLDPVKSLKTVYVDDKHITVNFAHAGHPEAFDIEVKDARGSVVYKKLANREWAMQNKISAGAKSWVQNMQRALLSKNDASNGHGDFRYFEKTKMYAYTISTEKLMRLSAYTISVTPVYDGQSAAKAATTKAKTTNIPASYTNCDIVNPEWNWGIYISNIFDENWNDWAIYFTSGNSYTLEAVVNDLAKARGTDTLTWKSSNPRVASVKANQGSYSATLKALQQGKTTITVTSKITKKTIARYHIAVKAVGKGSSYGGDYETGGNRFYDSFIKTVDPYYEGRLEVLTVSNPVNVTDEDMLYDPVDNRVWQNLRDKNRTWVQFTAPSYGEYTFSNSKEYQIYYSNGTEVDFDEVSSTYGEPLRLEENQRIYFRIEGTFTLRVSEYVDFTKLTTSFTKDKPLKVTKDMWITFIAPEDNYYTFNGTMDEAIEKYETQSNTTYVYADSFGLGMKAGDSVFIKVKAGAEFYVTKRDLSKSLAVGDTGVGMSFTKDNAQETQYVSFKADVTGDYSFTYSPSDEIDVEFLAVSDDTKYADGDAVVAPKVKPMAETTEPGTPAEPASETVKLFMEGGETIVIAVTAKNPSSITGDKKIDVTIKAATTAVKALGSEQTVPKGTSQMFEYTIPNDEAATKYTVVATEGASVEWYYSKTQKEIGYNNDDTQLGVISGIADNSFTIKEGKVVNPNLTGNRSLNAGDKIYVKVTADGTADSKVTLTSVADNKVFDAITPANVELGAKIGDAVWYTFTVKKPGYYEFSKKVTPAPAEAVAQDVRIEHVKEAFSNYPSYDPDINLYGDTSGVKKLNAGTYVFKITANSDAADGVKTTVALSVKEIVPTVLSKGDTPVTLAKDEVKYYSFKAATNEKFQIKWTPDAETGTADAEYATGNNLAEASFDDSLPATIGSANYYIRLTQTGDKNVSGKLQVVADEKNFLTSGKEESFEIKEDGGSIEYTFTTPEDSKLGYVVIVENTSAVPEGQSVPTITVKSQEYPGDIINNLPKGKASKEETLWTNKFQTKTIIITANNVTEPVGETAGISATGKIMIKPVSVQTFAEAVGKVKKGDEPKWYTYTIPADGRYMFDYAVGAEQDKSSVNVKWYGEVPNRYRSNYFYEDAPYLTKGQEIYVSVEAISDTEAGVDVTLKTPAVLTATALSLTDGKAETDISAEMVANGAVYYTFKALEYAVYTVEGNYYDLVRYAPKKYQEDGESYYSDYWESGSVLDKEEEILIKVTEPTKLTITKDAVNKLILNQESAEITLKKDERAIFELGIFEDGYYDFRVSDAKGLDIDVDPIYSDTVNRCYFATEISQEDGRSYRFSVTNPGAEEAKIKVTAGKLEPVDLKVGTTDVSVTKDRISIISFKVPENYWYTVACSAGSELSGEIEAGDKFYSKRDKPLSSVLTYSGTEATATAKVTIAKLAPEPAPVEGNNITISLEAGQSKWYAYRTTAAGRYTFTLPAGVELKCYDSLESNSPKALSNIRAGANTDLFIKVTNVSEAKVEEVSITAKCEEPATGLMEGETTITVDSYQMTYLTFKAPVDGLYEFRTSNGYISYYGQSAWSTYVGGSSHYYIKKDSVVYLTIDPYSANPMVVTVTKTRDVTFLGHVDVEEGKYQWITFTAENDGEYIFTGDDVKNNTNAWFFRNKDVIGDNATADKLLSASFQEEQGAWGNIYWYPGYRYEKPISLKQGEKVDIAVGGRWLENSTSCDVYVYVEE